VSVYVCVCVCVKLIYVSRMCVKLIYVSQDLCVHSC